MPLDEFIKCNKKSLLFQAEMRVGNVKNTEKYRKVF
jgi:hypothetical protein